MHTQIIERLNALISAIEGKQHAEIMAKLEIIERAVNAILKGDAADLEALRKELKASAKELNAAVESQAPAAQ